MCQFSRKPKKGKKYKGVFVISNNYSKKSSKYIIAKIVFNHKTIYLGSFFTQEKAAIAYNKAAKELFGENAFLNSIEQN